MSNLDRVIGVDPGLRCTGWGVVDVHRADGSSKLMSSGVIRSDPGAALAVRLLELYDALESVIDTWKPGVAAVEQPFVNSNPATSLKLGHARAAALLAVARRGITVFEYAPNVIKKSLVGVGHAAKSQVHFMVRAILPEVNDDSHDAIDALATAICHVHHVFFRKGI